MSEKVVLRFGWFDSPRELEVAAVVVGSVAVHRCWSWTELMADEGLPAKRFPGFRISHVVTGACLMDDEFRTRKAAVKTAQRIDRLHGRGLRRVKQWRELLKAQERPAFKRTGKACRELIRRAIRRDLAAGKASR